MRARGWPFSTRVAAGVAAASVTRRRRVQREVVRSLAAFTHGPTWLGLPGFTTGFAGLFVGREGGRRGGTGTLRRGEGRMLARYPEYLAVSTEISADRHRFAGRRSRG